MLKQSYTYLLLSLLMAVPFVHADFKFKDSSIVGRGKLGNLELYHSDEEGYSALRNGKREYLSTVNIAAELRALKTFSLEKLQDNSDFLMAEDSNGELTLKLQQKIKGSGPYVAHGMYWLVKGGHTPCSAEWRAIS